MNATKTAHVTGDGALAASLAAHGYAASEPEQALVLDASHSEPRTWDDMEAQLLDAFHLSRRAMTAGAPIVYVVDGEALYGHRDPLPAALATGLVGGARSLAAEGARAGTPVYIVTGGDDPKTVADAVDWLLRSKPPTGQLLHADLAHVGRPAV